MREESKAIEAMFSGREFEIMLRRAKNEARAIFEFVNNTEEMFEEFGQKMRISEKHVELLSRIASGVM